MKISQAVRAGKRQTPSAFLLPKRKRGKFMRNLDTPVKKIRRQIFAEISRVAFESTDENFQDEIEAIPYHIVQERATYRESIYRERAVASERVRLAMGMSRCLSPQAWRPAILMRNTMSRR